MLVDGRLLKTGFKAIIPYPDKWNGGERGTANGGRAGVLRDGLRTDTNEFPMSFNGGKVNSEKFFAVVWWWRAGRYVRAGGWRLLRGQAGDFDPHDAHGGDGGSYTRKQPR